MKKVKYLLFTIVVALICIFNVKAFELKYVENAQKIMSKYSFTPNFIKGTTTVNYNYGSIAQKCTEEICRNWNNGGQNDYYLTKDNYQSAINAGIYVDYINVGKYQGKQVDLRLSLVDITFVEDGQYAQFGFRGNEIAVDSHLVDEIKYKVDYLIDGKSTNIKSVISYTDIDGPTPYQNYHNESAERIGIDISSAAVGYIYKTYGEQHFSTEVKNNFQYLLGTRNWTGSCGSEVNYEASTTDSTYYSHDGDVNCSKYQGEEGEFRGGFGQNAQALSAEEASANQKNFSKAGIVTVVYDKSPFTLSWNHYYIGLSDVGFLQLEEKDPVKKVDKSQATTGDVVTYTIIQAVPNQADEWYYKSWIISDQIPEQLSLTASDVSIIDDSNKDVTDNFDISVVDNKLVISAKESILSNYSFYNNEYKITVKTTVNAKAVNGDLLVNKAYHTIENYKDEVVSKESNEVNVEIVVEETATDVEVPSTSSTISIVFIILGVVIVAVGTVMYIVVSKKLKENKQ